MNQWRINSKIQFSKHAHSDSSDTTSKSAERENPIMIQFRNLLKKQNNQSYIAQFSSSQYYHQPMEEQEKAEENIYVMQEELSSEYDGQENEAPVCQWWDLPPEPRKPTTRSARKTTKITKPIQSPTKISRTKTNKPRKLYGLKGQQKTFYETASYRYQLPFLSNAITTISQRIENHPMDDESEAIVPELIGKGRVQKWRAQLKVSLARRKYIAIE